MVGSHAAKESKIKLMYTCIQKCCYCLGTVSTVVWKLLFSTENISMIIKFKVKHFHGYMTSLKYSYLEQYH